MKVMVNFQLGKLNVKDEMINNVTSVGQRKKKVMGSIPVGDSDFFSFVPRS